MTNKEILDRLIQEYGPLQAYLFCRMECAKFTYLHENCVKTAAEDCNEYDFERDWWRSAEKVLDKRINNL